MGGRKLSNLTSVNSSLVNLFQTLHFQASNSSAVEPGAVGGGHDRVAAVGGRCRGGGGGQIVAESMLSAVEKPGAHVEHCSTQH